MKESIYWGRKLTYGHPYRSVCWLVGLTAYDYYCPEDYTIVYEFVDPNTVRAPAYRGAVFFWTLDLEEAQRHARAFYKSGTRFIYQTTWRTPDGLVAKKSYWVKRWKEANDDSDLHYIED